LGEHARPFFRGLGPSGTWGKAITAGERKKSAAKRSANATCVEKHVYLGITPKNVDRPKKVARSRAETGKGEVGLKNTGPTKRTENSEDKTFRFQKTLGGKRVN